MSKKGSIAAEVKPHVRQVTSDLSEPPKILCTMQSHLSDFPELIIMSGRVVVC